MAFNQSCYGVRGKENVSNTDYLYYLLKHTVTQLQAVSHGAVFDTITRATFELIDIALPGLAEQAEIASVLGTLDDRIENLRATNETLEAIVQTLFKSWFVDFDPVKAKAECRAPVGMDAETAKLFPSEFEESELGPIPKGWATRKADELFEVGIGKTPPRKEPQWFSSEPKNVPWVSIRDMGEQGSFIAATNEYLTTEAVERFNVRLVPDKTVLLSFKLTVGRVSISDGPVTTNEAIAHFKPLEQSLPYTYLFEYLRQFNFEALGSTSSIAEATNSKVIRGLPILTPSPGLAAAFHVAVTPLFDGMRANQREQKALTQIRDQLLPKLISGELRLPGFGDNAE